MFGTLIATIFPARCAACHTLCPPDHIFCLLCETTVNPATFFCQRCGRAGEEGEMEEEKECVRCLLDPPALFRTNWTWEFGAAVQQAITRFKYGNRSDLARPLSRAYVPQPGVQYDYIIPIPLHPRRYRSRHYNQAALLANEISKHTDASVRHRALQRTRDTPSQIGLTAHQRQKNIRGAFAVHKQSHLTGKTLLLVDDVATTGATLLECARVLQRAGAVRVDGWTIARRL